jgi:hypothetical protein
MGKLQMTGCGLRVESFDASKAKGFEQRRITIYNGAFWIRHS